MRTFFITLGTLLFSAMASAAPELSVRGFGTLGTTHNFSHGAEVIRDIGQPDGPRNGTSFDVDSRLGLQLDAQFGPRLSGTLQGVSRYNYQGKYTPELTLALLKYEFDNSQIRVGRLGWDIYSMSDSRDVGYAFLWVRPPVEYFGKLQRVYLDGADLRVNRLLGPGLLSAKIYAGLNGERVSINENSYADQEGTFLYGGHMEYHYREWMGRISYSYTEAETEIRGEQGRQLRAVVDSGDPQAIAFLEYLGLPDPEIEVEVISASLIYDRGPLQVQLMLSHDRFIGTELGDKTHRGFITTSYRLGDWTPYLTFSRSHSPGFTIPGQLEGTGIATLVENQHSVSFGARYDFRKNMALKIQADHFNVRREGRGGILWRGVQEDWDGHINQLSVTLDFIF